MQWVECGWASLGWISGDEACSVQPSVPVGGGFSFTSSGDDSLLDCLIPIFLSTCLRHKGS